MNPYSKNSISLFLATPLANFRFSLNRQQQLLRALKGQSRLLELQKQYNWDRNTLISAVLLLDDPYPFMLHFSAFMSVIENQGTEEQIREWIPLCERMEVLGTTDLSSNLT